MLISVFTYSVSDDNVYMGNEFPDKSIINLRNKLTGEQMPNDEYLDLFLVQVEPVDSILNRNYFIEKVELCEKRWKEFVVKNKQC